MWDAQWAPTFQPAGPSAASSSLVDWGRSRVPLTDLGHVGSGTCQAVIACERPADGWRMAAGSRAAWYTADRPTSP